MRTWMMIWMLIVCALQTMAQADSSAKKKPAAPRQTPAAAATRPAATHKGKPDSAQTAALHAADSLKARVADSLLAAAPKVHAYDTIMRSLLEKNTFLSRKGKPVLLDVNPTRKSTGQDWLVYLVAGVVLLLGIIRSSYLKYFNDMFRAFFNPTLSQRQLKDQLSQSPFPNFLLNFFFIISLGLYLYLLMYRLDYPTDAIAWMLIPGLMLLVGIIYLVKYVVLRFCGWLFGSEELVDAYVFILYLINKVLGILLAPFLVVLAFCSPEIASICLYISIFFIVLLVVYRYVRSYSLVRQYLSFSKLHFFLYLCAFEVVPVLIITKVLLLWLTGNP
ncbi:DUF4271 domain-containing protein [Chitinophaga rhizosphaerae]|uniref:DUF4271 domain-containing protein n=1 Tax=Chitinophaga rhizosphaerae TaxID=1864947 RepID=UPI000F8111D2|nr:DUF4271 domain-containing protein [Chitinophaga rhizosphaerae]